MWLFKVIMIVFIALIIYVIISTIIKLVLLVTVKYKYDNKILIIPSFLTLLSWIITGTIWHFTLTAILNKNVITFLFDNYIQKLHFGKDFGLFIGLSILLIVIGIILQALAYLSVNIDYIKIKGSIRCLFKKIFKIDYKEQENTDIVIDDRPKNLTFVNSLVASLFSFSLIFFITLILLALGHIISNKII